MPSSRRRASRKRNSILPIHPPKQVLRLIDRLQKHGFEAYAVGGCIRDSLLGLSPNDWDLTCSAHPEEVAQALSDYPVLPTGLQHGTVTVFIDGLSVEITTYRVDGAYSDGRHPDSVSFSRNLLDDLARRDFTVNAIAYHPNRGLVDPYNGLHDLHSRTLRCVGMPEQRFQEDALRILRGLRFASTLGFTIEKKTAYAIFQQRDLLNRIAEERIQVEFSKLLCGRDAERILRKYQRVISVFLPEITPMVGLEQHSPYHIYDVWEHTLHAISAIEPKLEQRLAVLLHDIAKPQCFSMDAKGVGHFYGHQNLGADIAKTILTRLRFSNEIVRTVYTLVKYHDVSITDEDVRIKRWLNRLGEPVFRMLLAVNQADTAAHSPAAALRMEMIEREAVALNRILAEQACFQRKDLAIKGQDLLQIGIPEGPEVGRILQELLDAVLENRCANQYEDLLAVAKQLYSMPSQPKEE